jgi:hypothetical protein
MKKIKKKSKKNKKKKKPPKLKYLQTALNHSYECFIKCNEITLIHFWSDRGSADFMNKDVISYLSYLRKDGFLKNIPFIFHTFQSKHGHNLCDSHFGNGKKIVKIKINEEKSSSYLTFDFVVKCFQSLKNTSCYINIPFAELDKEKFPKNITYEKGFRNIKYFDFRQKELKMDYYSDYLI